MQRYRLLGALLVPVILHAGIAFAADAQKDSTYQSEIMKWRAQRVDQSKRELASFGWIVLAERRQRTSSAPTATTRCCCPTPKQRIKRGFSSLKMASSP